MSEWKYKFAEIAGYLKKLYGEIKQLDSRLKNLENKDRNVNEPKVPYSGLGSPFSPFLSFPVLVTSISTNNFYGSVRMPSDANSWVADDILTSSLRAVLAPGATMPDINDIVSINFTGTYGGSFDYLYGDFDHDREIAQVKGSPTTVERVRNLEFDSGFFTVTCIGSWHAFVSLGTSTTTITSITLITTVCCICVCPPSYYGGIITFPQKKQTFTNGLLTGYEDLPSTTIDISGDLP